MKYGISLPSHDQENIWRVVSGFSKHTNGDKIKFLSLKQKDSGNNGTFEKYAPTKIKCKGIVSFNEKIKFKMYYM